MVEQIRVGYRELADTLRAEIFAGRWDAIDQPFPAAKMIADRFGVSRPTASRAFQLLAAEGLLQMRHKAAPEVVPPDARSTSFPAAGAYARARAEAGLLFGDRLGPTTRKDTISVEWAIPPDPVRGLLRTGPNESVLCRRSHTVADGRTLEDTLMHFPRWLIDLVPELEHADRIRVVPLIEATGRTIVGTDARLTARPATATEAQVLDDRWVLQSIHGTFAMNDPDTTDPDQTPHPVEAVINIRPASSTVIEIQTNERPTRSSSP